MPLAQVIWLGGLEQMQPSCPSITTSQSEYQTGIQPRILLWAVPGICDNSSMCRP
jgi:hypothetical protein